MSNTGNITRAANTGFNQEVDKTMTTPTNDETSSRSIKPDCGHVSTISHFEALLARSGTADAVAVQGLDLCDYTDEILSAPWPEATFLGCSLTTRAEQHLITTGATIFPRFDDLPYNPYRGALYTSQELRKDDLDGRIYEHQARWRKNPPAPILEALAQRIHDHAIDDALNEYLAGHAKVVAVMGGHSLHRDDATYRSVAVVTRALTRAGYLIVTGGGPGAMEAGNLGAWLANHPDDALDTALVELSTAVDYSTEAYLEASQRVIEAFPNGATSLAIPTWFYGHEPTNDFATEVAKYFSNSIREDGLLAIATHGVVYTPGAAGTVQEVFMDATQNHYSVFGIISPMIFLDSAYWADDRLAAPLLLKQLAGERPYKDMVAVFDEPQDIVDFISSHPPIEVEP